MSDATKNPYEGEHEEVPTAQMELLGRLVQQLAETERAEEVKALELKEVQDRARKLREFDIPELLLQCNLREATTLAGLHVKLREAVRANVPKDPTKRAEAFAWLEEAGHGGLIKRKFVITFGRGDEAWAKKFEADLKRRKTPVALERRDDIANNTLCAFLKEQLQDGKIGPELLKQHWGGFVQKFAEVDRED